MAETCYSEYIDLGLPSGTLWATENVPTLYTFDEAVAKFKDNLPNKEQFIELCELCTWKWRGDGYTVIGPNGNDIFLPASHYRFGTITGNVCYYSYYWSSTSYNANDAYSLYFDSNGIYPHNNYFRYNFRNVQLVKQKETNNMNKLEIEIPNEKEIDWEESKKQNKIILKDKQLTYKDICKKLFENKEFFFTNTTGVIESSSPVSKEYLIGAKNNSTSYHQLECIMAKNKLANVAKYLNDGWKPAKGTRAFAITYTGNFDNEPIIGEFYFGNGENLVLFRTQKSAQQAIEILGEETIKLALEPLGI